MDLYFVKLRRKSIFHLLNIIYWKLVSKMNRLEKIFILWELKEWKLVSDK